MISQNQHLALVSMLELQDRMNTKVHPHWIKQNYEWYRAVWIECAELMDHYGYKWWKKQDHDLEQVQLEVIDIWHFGMSALFREGATYTQLAEEIATELTQFNAPAEVPDVLMATEALAGYSLQHRAFSVGLFWQLLAAAELDFDTLYRRYVGKNVLNFFRQDHGYKDGSYIKIWAGEEDNVHLMQIINEQDAGSAGFADDVYRELKARYPG